MPTKLSLEHYPYDKVEPTHVPSQLVPYLHDRIIKPIITSSKYLSYHNTYQLPLSIVYSYSSFLSTSSSLFTLSNSLIYVNDNNTITDDKIDELSNLISIDNNEDNTSCDITSYTRFPLLEEGITKIWIPKKVKLVVERHVPKKMIRQINNDEEAAVEMCLVFLSYFSETYFNYKNSDVSEDYKFNGYKSLSSRILEETFGRGIYKRIVEALLEPTKEGPIIECDTLPIRGVKNYYYRLGAAYLGKGIETYHLKNKAVKTLRLRSYYKRIAKAESNPIAKNLFNIYPQITLPSIEEINQEAKRLIKQGYHTRKKKKLTYLNKHTKDYFKDADHLSFVEDNIKLFQYLTENGFMIPFVGDEKSGGRVVDSFTLMPSWIRALVKINGVSITEVDYKALHPNIAITLYCGNMKYITHDKIAELSGVDPLLVKKEHLSFFNKHPEQMKQSPLYDYYKRAESGMIKNIIDEKYRSEKKYKSTSMRMFKAEVDVMAKVITILNAEGILVLYIYDALACHPSVALRVKQVMDEVILEMGVHTVAEIKGVKAREIEAPLCLPTEPTILPKIEPIETKEVVEGLGTSEIVTETQERLIEHIKILNEFGVPKDFLRAVLQDVRIGKIVNRQQIEDLLEKLKVGLYAA